MKIGKVICENAVEDNNNIYFSVFHGNGLYSYNKITSQSKRLGTFPEQPLNKIRLYDCVVKVDSKIIAAPSYGDGIISIYHMDSGEFENIDIRKSIGRNVVENSFKFKACFRYEDHIYFIGCAYPAILKMNVNTYAIKCIDNWVGEVQDEAMDMYLLSGFVRGEIAYLPFIQTSAFLKLDLKTDATEIVRFDTSIKCFSGVVEGNNNDLWFVANFEPKAINVSLCGEVLEEVELYETPQLVKGSGIVEKPKREGNGFYLFPVCAEHVYYFDFSTKECEICKEFEEIASRELGDKTREHRRLFNFQTRPHFVYLIENGTKIWHEVDLRTREIKTFNVLQDLAPIINRLQHGIRECPNDTLPEFLEFVKVYETRA